MAFRGRSPSRVHQDHVRDRFKTDWKVRPTCRPETGTVEWPSKAVHLAIRRVVASISSVVPQILMAWQLTCSLLSNLLLDILSPPAYYRAMRFDRLALHSMMAVRA